MSPCAYGWDDLAEEAEAEHLTEETETEFAYQKRFFWPAAFCGLILARLLDLTLTADARRRNQRRLTTLQSRAQGLRYTRRRGRARDSLKLIWAASNNSILTWETERRRTGPTHEQ